MKAPAALDPETQWRYFLEFGSQSNASFHFQDGLRFFHLAGVGFVSFHLRKAPGGTPLVFTKPLCADGDLPALLGAFLAEHGPGAVFLGMDGTTAAVLGSLGFSVNEFGADFSIPVQTFTVKGRAQKHLRNVRHLAERGVEVKELAPAEVPLEEVQRISSLWLQGKRVRNRELRFLTRPPEFQGGMGVRRFYCFLEGRLVGYVFLDPFFRGGRVLGYCANILRCEPGLRPQGILDFALLQALEKFRGEGVQTLALGIAPLHGLAPCPGEDRLLRWFGQALYRWGGALYNFRELAFHKARFRGEATKVYFCKRGIGCLGAAALSLQATNLLPDWRAR